MRIQYRYFFGFLLVALPGLVCLGVFLQTAYHGPDNSVARACYYPVNVESGRHIWTGDGGPTISPARSPVPLPGWNEYTYVNGMWVQGNG